MRNLLKSKFVIFLLMISVVCNASVTTAFACGEPNPDEDGNQPRYGQTPSIRKDGITIWPTCYGSYIYPELPGRLYKPGDPDAPKSIKIHKVLDPRDKGITYKYYYSSIYADPSSSGYKSFTSTIPLPGYSDNKSDRNNIFANLITTRDCPDSDYNRTCNSFFVLYKYDIWDDNPPKISVSASSDKPNLVNVSVDDRDYSYEGTDTKSGVSGIREIRVISPDGTVQKQVFDAPPKKIIVKSLQQNLIPRIQ